MDRSVEPNGKNPIPARNFTIRNGVLLKGFRRVFIKKGETIHVTIPLKAEDLSYWDTGKNAFILEKGKISFFVGPSSVESRLKGEITAR